ncbi:MAG: PspC domain-containing protein [Bacteroidaceae bacterium]|nr:PspC domain-containing protein [Bacteroidaceae bacterium]
MKKSFNVNLGGRIFQIDEDAYEQLNDYLVSVKTCFMNNNCGEEIAADIEARMGELFAERTAADSNIINLRLVNEMIARMGKPESMVDEDGEGDADKSNKSADGTADSQTSQTKNDGNFSGRLSMRKKLFRDGDHKMLGGVISGLSAYIKVDVTLLRIVAILLFFVTTFWAFLFYLIAWAIIPLAITTTDKLRMQGVEPTPENIAERLIEEEPAIDKIMRNLKEVDNKGIVRLLTILACVLLVSMLIAPMCKEICFPLRPVHSYFGFMPLFIVLGWIGGMSILAIPVITVVLALSSKWGSLSASVKWLLLIDWILAFVQVSVFSNLFLF